VTVIRPDEDALAAWRELNVDAVLTGSVQRANERLRVTVEMVNVLDGRIVWGKTFDDSSANIFALQDSIVGEVARVLNVQFSSRGYKSPQRGFGQFSRLQSDQFPGTTSRNKMRAQRRLPLTEAII